MVAGGGWIKGFQAPRCDRGGRRPRLVWGEYVDCGWVRRRWRGCRQRCGVGRGFP